MNRLKRLICFVFGHERYCFVRFEYPRFAPALWTRCRRCDRALDKESLAHLPVSELREKYGVRHDSVALDMWSRYGGRETH